MTFSQMISQLGGLVNSFSNRTLLGYLFLNEQVHQIDYSVSLFL
jgi:hypothetical protein